MTGIGRIAIVNRGEAAMRLIHAAAETDGATSIALHTSAERSAMFVREADEAYCLDDFGASASPYLDLDLLRSALIGCRAEAVWVGWGFVAERAEFADMVADLGLTFIGPSGDVMRLLGDKIAAKQLAEKAQVPMAPWSGGPVDTVEDATSAAHDIGFPLMVKAAAGGGGRGIRRVDRIDDLAKAFESATAEGLKSFGDATVFLERVVGHARHVEVQIIADDHGEVWAPGIRDCSVQRRNQKVIEESSSTALTTAAEDELRAAAIRLAKEAGYRNAGTVEFLYQPDDDLLAFLEVNTRLQVEHPITELTAGIDLVKLQLHVASGGQLGPVPGPSRGHAIEARLNAEDPANDFAPAAGQITTLRLPVGPGVRVDTGVAEGDRIAPEYDSMIAKVIAWGRDRDEALARLKRAISQTTVLVDGGTTNKSFLLQLLDHPQLRSGAVTTSWLDGLTSRGEHQTLRLADVALAAAAVDVHDEHLARERGRFFSSAARGRPDSSGDVGFEIALNHLGADHRIHVASGGTGWYRLTSGDRVCDVIHHRIGTGQARIEVGSVTHRVVSQVSETDVLVEVDGVVHRFSRDDGGLLRAPAVSLVVSMDVAVGDVVEAGQRVALVEAMKMETAITTPVAGVVEEVCVTANMQVDAGAPLVRIGTGDGGGGGEAESIILPSVPIAAGEAAAVERLAALRGVVLGYDVGERTVDELLARHLAGDELLASPRVRAAELQILRTFADLVGLTRDRRQSEQNVVEVRSPMEAFHRYLRVLDADSADLPDRFRGRLTQALAHFGLESLDHTPALEQCLYRIHRAASRRDAQLGLITALLERRLAEEPDGDSDELRETLDSVITATQAQYPSIGNLARSVRHKHVDQPLITLAGADQRAAIRADLARLEAGAEPETLGRLIDSPVPLMPLIGQVDALGSAASGALVEVLLRRFYKIRDLAEISSTGGPHPTMQTSYRHNGRVVRVLATTAHLEDVHGVLERLAALVEGGAGDADVTVFDLYLRTDAECTEHDVAAVTALAAAEIDLPPSVARIVVVAAPAGVESEAATTVTFRRDLGTDGPLVEDIVFRGLHPMVARRLNLWRLSNFDVGRLPSAPDTFIFDCEAIENSKDKRLIAVAEVRDSTPVRDADGRLVALPELERVLASCLDGIRRARAADVVWQRHEWNRVLLYVWPVVEISPGEVQAVAKRLVPLTNGLGLEQVIIQGRVQDPDSGAIAEVVFRMSFEPGRGLVTQITDVPTEPMLPLDSYAQKVIQCRRRGLVYPYELIPTLLDTGAGEGRFIELDLDDAGVLVPVDRQPGLNATGVVIGRAITPTDLHPDGIERIVVLGDPTRSMGSISEAECRRLLAAIDLAAAEQIPIEWFALSAGARISMDSGSENLDWVAAVLRRIVEHTQAGGVIDIVVAGVNVGAQPYWNAEATMLMHTKGILVMTPESTMVLTGKQAIDFSGGVSAEDNLGIGGHERIMGPNGQAQYWAEHMAAAISILHRHRALTYVVPGERGPRRVASSDPADRDVRSAPHADNGTGFSTVGDVFSLEANPDRKKPFDIRSVMRAVADADHAPLERWAEMAEAEAAVVWDTRLGGHAVCMIGVESRPLPRPGFIPADGPGSWSAGTLFPLSSKKIARAINSASGNRPVVVLANLSGFDGSPESLRRLQLEYGAEIGRAIVNFDGPIVLCVVSRYHGGAFVVFSGRLNDRMEVLAVEGAHASVIGGSPAAAVVFTREVDLRTQRDDRIVAFERRIGAAAPVDRAALRAELVRLRDTVRNEMLGVVAAEFDAVHSVERAQSVGSVDRIISAMSLRPELIASVERGLRH